MCTCANHNTQGIVLLEILASMAIVLMLLTVSATFMLGLSRLQKSSDLAFETNTAMRTAVNLISEEVRYATDVTFPETQGIGLNLAIYPGAGSRTFTYYFDLPEGEPLHPSEVWLYRTEGSGTPVAVAKGLHSSSYFAPQMVGQPDGTFIQGKGAVLVLASMDSRGQASGLKLTTVLLPQGTH